MPDLEEIIDGLRRDAAWETDGCSEWASIPLADAVAAVHAAADARTQEIVDALRDLHASGYLIEWGYAADEVARRFPNGGTPGEPPA